MENTRITHYDVGRLLGRGGMGEVYEAVDVDLGRKVALKFLAPELAADPESVRRFEREARSAAALNHPHIATLYAFERADGRPCIAMELVTGESLRERIRRGPLPVDEALRVARDVAAALAAAHRAGIVHRDVKPENLMFDERGAIKVMDFGLAHAAHASRLTMTGTTLGTAGYMAPEALHGAVDAPADVFALGVVLHEMLAGTLPFAGDVPMVLLFNVANEPPRPLREARPETPQAAADLVLRTLAKDPARRPVAESVERELTAILGGAPLPLVPAGARTEEVEVTRLPAVAGDAALAPVAPPPKRPRRWRAAGAAVVLVAAGGLAAWSSLSSRAGEAKRREAIRISNRGVAALDADSLEAARGYFKAALDRDPRSGQAMLNLAFTYLRQGDDARAESLYTLVLRRHPRDNALRAMALYNLGEIEIRAGTWEGAVKHLEESFALDSSSAGIYNNLGQALVMAGRAGDARLLLERGLDRFPNVAAIHKNIGLAALELGNARGALAHAGEAIGLDPTLASAQGLRARALARLGEKADARSAWEDYVKLEPDPAERADVERDLKARGVL